MDDAIRNCRLHSRCMQAQKTLNASVFERDVPRHPLPQHYAVALGLRLEIVGTCGINVKSQGDNMSPLRIFGVIPRFREINTESSKVLPDMRAASSVPA